MRISILIFSIVFGVIAQASHFEDVVTQKDGSPARLTYWDAEDYCVRHGDRLPTVFEFIDLAVSKGAEIRTTQIKTFFPIYDVFKSKPAEIHFYYSSERYRAPKEALEQLQFWSSSLLPGYSVPAADGYTYFADPAYYSFDGKYARLLGADPSFGYGDFPAYLAVRCISDK